MGAYYLGNFEDVQCLPHDSGKEVSHEVFRIRVICVLRLDYDILIDADSRG